MQDIPESAGPLQQKGINTEMWSAENMFGLENYSNWLSFNIFNISKMVEVKTYWCIRNIRKDTLVYVFIFVNSQISNFLTPDHASYCENVWVI